MNEGLNRVPFRNEDEKLFSDNTTQSKVFEFTDPKTGEAWMRKEMKFQLYDHRSPDEVAKDKNAIYRVLKEYLGDCIPETHYVVAKDDMGRPCVQIVQKKIFGATLQAFLLANRNSEKYDENVEMISRQLTKVSKDIRLKDNPDVDRVFEGRREYNMIVDSEGKVWVVDW